MCHRVWCDNTQRVCVTVCGVTTHRECVSQLSVSYLRYYIKVKSWTPNMVTGIYVFCILKTKNIQIILLLYNDGKFNDGPEGITLQENIPRILSATA